MFFFYVTGVMVVKTLCVTAATVIYFLSVCCQAEHGDYLNEFIVHINGDLDNVNTVISHLQKRPTHIVNAVSWWLKVASSQTYYSAGL